MIVLNPQCFRVKWDFMVLDEHWQSTFCLTCSFWLSPRAFTRVCVCSVLRTKGVKVLFCCNLSYVTRGQILVQFKCCKLFWNECNLLSCAAFCMVGRFKVGPVSANEKSHREWGGGGFQWPRPFGQLLDLFLPSHRGKKKHSYRVACVVGQNVSCIDDILPQKIREDI